jgi:AcrR family transcriptional regulator
MRFDRPMDRRVRRSRKLMQDALLNLLETHDYSKISVSQITDKADVARTTFYSHFQSKDELLLSYIDDIFETFFTKLLDQYPHPSISSLEHKVPLLLLEEWKKNKEALDRIRSANVDYLIFQRIRENLLNAFQEEAARVLGGSSSPVVEQYLASFVSAAIFAVLIQWSDNGMKEPSEAVAKLIYRLVRRKGLDEIRENLVGELDLTRS